MPICRFNPDALGFADTVYPCRPDRDGGELIVTGPPPGMVSVGGYRFILDQLQDAVTRPRATRCSPPCPMRWPAIAWPAPPPTVMWFATRLPARASIR